MVRGSYHYSIIRTLRLLLSISDDDEEHVVASEIDFDTRVAENFTLLRFMLFTISFLDSEKESCNNDTLQNCYI